MLINIHAAKCIGIDAVPVTVEIDIAQGIGLHLVGLADAAVKESLLRTVTALQSSGFKIPGKKIVINLAPADMHKKGSGYDVPIALGIIAASGQRRLPLVEDFMVMGELSLDAMVRDVPGALPIVESAARQGLRGCILPLMSAMEAVEFGEIDVYGVESLEEVLQILSGEDSKAFLIANRLRQVCGRTVDADVSHSDDASKPGMVDFSDIMGQEGAKRGVEIAAAGGHNVIRL